MNTATASFDTTVRQMTKMSQRVKPKWTAHLSLPQRSWSQLKRVINPALQKSDAFPAYSTRSVRPGIIQCQIKSAWAFKTKCGWPLMGESASERFAPQLFVLQGVFCSFVVRSHFVLLFPVLSFHLAGNRSSQQKTLPPGARMLTTLQLKTKTLLAALSVTHDRLATVPSTCDVTMSASPAFEWLTPHQPTYNFCSAGVNRRCLPVVLRSSPCLVLFVPIGKFCPCACKRGMNRSVTGRLGSFRKVGRTFLRALVRSLLLVKLKGTGEGAFFCSQYLVVMMGLTAAAPALATERNETALAF